MSFTNCTKHVEKRAFYLRRREEAGLRIVIAKMFVGDDDGNAMESLNDEASTVYHWPVVVLCKIDDFRTILWGEEGPATPDDDR